MPARVGLVREGGEGVCSGGVWSGGCLLPGGLLPGGWHPPKKKI